MNNITLTNWPECVSRYLIELSTVQLSTTYPILIVSGTRGIVELSIVDLSTVQLSMIECSIVESSTVQLSIVDLSIVELSTMQSSTMQLSIVDLSIVERSTTYPVLKVSDTQGIQYLDYRLMFNSLMFNSWLFNLLRAWHKTAKRYQKNPISYKSVYVKWGNFGDPKLYLRRYEIVICRYQKLTNGAISCPNCSECREKGRGSPYITLIFLLYIYNIIHIIDRITFFTISLLFDFGLSVWRSTPTQSRLYHFLKVTLP